ncbi:MAG: hypothetical protein GQF41_1314 [Candidatus Rifleibacterium amylolyticum]|nr:MAG: hypothetical protein GQF41_1314 [Candidatus Rifleibacterium amylolyticum]NLF95350.1 hypothetical protein [Candidatus Riflebacteria bacterium]
MQFNKAIITVILSLLICDLAAAQNISHWQRIPAHGEPELIRHPLQHTDQSGELFRLRYETLPATTMMRRIRRGFSELFPEPVPEESYIDISRSTQQLEKLDIEADNALELGYDELDLSNNVSIFDSDRAIDITATDSSILPETSELMPATVSFPISEE